MTVEPHEYGIERLAERRECCWKGKDTDIFYLAERAIGVGGQHHGHRGLTGWHLPGLTYIAGALEDVETGGRHLVVTCDECRLDVTESELYERIEQGTVEREVLMTVGGIVAVAVVADGYQRTDGIVGRLHEAGGAGHLFALLVELAEKGFGMVDASKTCAGDDGIGLADARAAHGFGGRDDSPPKNAAHTTRLHRTKPVAERGVGAAHVRDFVDDGLLHPTLAEGLLDGYLSGRLDIDAGIIHAAGIGR
jgi:hypothetical protein